MQTFLARGGKITFLVLLFLSGCTPASPEDFRAEGEAQAKELIRELQEISTREALCAAAPRLKRRFAKLTDLILIAHEYLEKHPLEPEIAGVISEELFAELARIYELPGGRELVELAQEESRFRLIQAMGLSPDS